MFGTEQTFSSKNRLWKVKGVLAGFILIVFEMITEKRILNI